jgi:peptidoglycan/LPS O-acetylase OafA/YrhL
MSSLKPFNTDRALHLDLVRIFACFWVITNHWTGHGADYFSLKHRYSTTRIPEFLKNIGDFGFLGVDIFFILSGYVILVSLTNGSVDGFLKRRFMRLFPSYFFSSLVSLIVFSHVTKDFRLADFAPSLSGLQFWFSGISIVGSSWSLQYEIQFYCLVGLLLLMCRLKSLQPTTEICANALLGWQILAIFSQNLPSSAYSKVLMLDTSTGDGFAFYFTLGAFLYLQKFYAVRLKSYVGIFFGFIGSYYEIRHRLLPLSTFRYIEFLGFFLVISVSIALSFGHRINLKVNSKKILRGVSILGLMTYPLYLLHETFGISILQLCLHEKISLSYSFLLTFAICFALSFFLVKFVDPIFKSWFSGLFGK